MKRLLVMCVFFLAAVSVATAAPGAEGGSSGEKAVYTAMVVAHRQVEDHTTTELTQYREEQTGVRIEFEVVPNNEGITLAFASGDLPDFALGPIGVNRITEQRWATQGILMPINEYLKTRAPNLGGLIQKYPALKQAISLPDGNIYQFPAVSQNNHTYMANKGWVWTPWLDVLGLDEPETVEDFREMLIAFKTKDPNGNGIADEIPMSGAHGTWNARPDDFLMNAFVEYNRGGNFLLLQGDKVRSAATLPAFREGLKFINGLYEDGLIDPAAFTQDLGQLGQLAGNPDVNIVGCYAAGHVGMGWDVATRVPDSQRILPLEGSNGRRGIPFWGVYVENEATIALSVSNNGVITREADDPGGIMEWIDWFYTREGSMWVVSGKEGKHWRTADTDQIGFLGQPASWTDIEQIVRTEAGNVQNVWYRAPGFFDEYVRLGKAQTPDAYEFVLTKATQEYERFISGESIPQSMYFPLDSSDELAQLTTVINAYLDEHIIRFITGDRDADAEWNAFQKELKNLDLDRMVEIYQQAYDAQYK